MYICVHSDTDIQSKNAPKVELRIRIAKSQLSEQQSPTKQSV